MKVHTNDFKNEIKKFGRQIDSVITYTSGGQTVELGAEQLNSITPHYEGSILKSVMKQLDIDSNVEIPEGTIINYKFGVKTRSGKNICPSSINDWESGQYSSSDGTKGTSNSRIRLKNLLKVNPSTTYYLNTYATDTNYKFVIRTYDSTGTFVRSIGAVNNNATITTRNTEYYLGITMYNSTSSSINFNTYVSLFESEDIKPFICLNSESDKSYEAYGEYDYVNFGNYVVYKVEKQEDTYSYKITCYDKMLYSMIPYEAMNITYPITIRNYLGAICTKLGLTFKNASDTFANYDKEILSELYLDSDGNSLDYTFRDVLDEIAGATGSTICINEDDDKLEVRYITDTNDTIDEEYLKDINVKFGEKYGPVNSIVLSRSAESDNIYLRDEESVLENGLCEIKIKDNQILNGNNRDEFLQDLLDALDGLEYYINDYSSTGITYYDLCDRYNVSIGNETYSCVMFNDEVDIAQGLEEQIFTEMPEESETDYSKSDKTDRKINQAYIIVDKQNQEINSVVQSVNTLSQMVDSQGNQIDALGTRITQNVNSITATITGIQNELDNGVDKVKTTSVTIDNDGISVSTDTSKIKTTMDNDSFEIKDSGGNTLAFFGYNETEGISKAEMDNLTVTNYFIAGVHRVETYEDNGEDRTGWFYIGG